MTVNTIHFQKRRFMLHKNEKNVGKRKDKFHAYLQFSFIACGEFESKQYKTLKIFVDRTNKKM